MRTYQVTLTGETPLLMHYDNIDWSDDVAEWLSNPDNKKQSKAGDDRTPAWMWLGSCYHDGKHLAIPGANMMRALMEGGAMVPTGGKNGKTFKAQTQSGMMSREPYWALTLNGKPIPWAPIHALRGQSAFSAHREAVRAMGFDLLVKRAKVGMSKHVRVRPMLPEGWQAAGTLVVWDEQITKAALERIVAFAGQYKGLGDWRPGGRTPGPYGRFSAQIE